METALLDEVVGRTAAIEVRRTDPPKAACLRIWQFIFAWQKLFPVYEESAEMDERYLEGQVQVLEIIQWSRISLMS